MSDQQIPIPDIKRTVVFNAPIEKVWDAVSTAEGVAVWFMPNDLKPVEGHEFQLEAGPYGNSPCKVTKVDPPNSLSFEWGKDWTITFELKEQGGKTEFTLIHSGWNADTVTEFNESHTKVRGRMDEGWGGILQNLGKHVEG